MTVLVTSNLHEHCGTSQQESCRNKVSAHLVDVTRIAQTTQRTGVETGISQRDLLSRPRSCDLTAMRVAGGQDAI